MRSRKAMLAALAATVAVVVALVVVLTSSGNHTTTGTQTPTGTHTLTTGSGRQMQFNLAASTSPVSVEVPSQPIGTTPTSVPGATLALYVAKRTGANAVLLVFAVNITPSTADNGDLTGNVQSGLDANANSGDFTAASGVSLFDPTGLKQYLTYMSNPQDNKTCLCTALNGVFNNGGPGTRYMAALVAAPPASVTSASFVTPLGTIANVPISG